MQRKHSAKYNSTYDNAQPWDSYVTDTISTDNQDNTNKAKMPMR